MKNKNLPKHLNENGGKNSGRTRLSTPNATEGNHINDNSEDKGLKKFNEASEIAITKTRKGYNPFVRPANMHIANLHGVG